MLAIREIGILSAEFSERTEMILNSQELLFFNAVLEVGHKNPKVPVPGHLSPS
jgi:hypothetical protein